MDKTSVYQGKVNHSHPSIVRCPDAHTNNDKWEPQYTQIISPKKCEEKKCGSNHHHCPLCALEITRYESKEDTQHHFVKIHSSQLFRFADHVILLCNLRCVADLPSHYHCPQCGYKAVRRLHMRHHLERCTAATSPKASAKRRATSPQGRGKRRKQVRRYSVRQDASIENLWENLQEVPIAANQEMPIIANQEVHITATHNNEENAENIGSSTSEMTADSAITSDVIEDQGEADVTSEIVTVKSETISQNQDPEVPVDGSHVEERERAHTLDNEGGEQANILDNGEGEQANTLDNGEGEQANTVDAEGEPGISSSDLEAHCIGAGNETIKINVSQSSGKALTESSGVGQDLQQLLNEVERCVAEECKALGDPTGGQHAYKLVRIEGHQNQYLIINHSGQERIDLSGVAEVTGGSLTVPDAVQPKVTEKSSPTASEQPEQSSSEEIPISHLSIVRQLQDLECVRCRTCCKMFHCPLCPTEIYKPKNPVKIRNHLLSHFSCGVQYKGWTSMKCNLPCSTEDGVGISKAHWHCPLCPQTKLHRSRLREHLTFHNQGRTRRLAKDKKFPEYYMKKPGPGVINAHAVANTDSNQELPEASEKNNEPSSEIDVPSITNDGAQINIPDEVDIIPREHVSDIKTHGEEYSEAIEGEVDATSMADDMQVNILDHVIPQEHVSHIKTEATQNGQSISAEISDHESDLKVAEIKYAPEVAVKSNHSIGKLSVDLQNVAKDNPQDSAIKENFVEILVTDSLGTQSDADVIAVANETPDDEKVTDHARPAKQAPVFQVVACLLSEELCSGLGDMLTPLIRELRDKTGAMMTPQEPDNHSYLAQGSWEELEQVRIILQAVQPHRVTTEEQLTNILTATYKKHPDLFPQEEDDIDIEVVSPGSAKELSSETIIKHQDHTTDTTLIRGQTSNNPTILPTKSRNKSGDQVNKSGDKGKMIYEDMLTTEINCEDFVDIEQMELPQISENDPCPYCESQFRYKTSLFSHIARRHNLRELPPGDQFVKWVDVVNRMRHVKQRKGTDCPACNKTFSNKLQAMAHYGAAICEAAALRDHEKETFVINPKTGMYHCDALGCDYKSKAQALLRQHKAYKHQEKTIPCPDCDKKFATNYILDVHIKGTHLLYEICPVCESNIKAKHMVEHLKHHEMVGAHAIGDNTMIKCSMCNYCTPKTVLYERHLKRVHGERDQKCPSCDMEFTNLGELNRHRRASHNDIPKSTSEPYATCHICSKEMLKRNIVAHIRLKHHNIRRYKCDVCSKVFQTKYVLECHKQTHYLPHQRQYRYVCSQCNMGFLNKTMFEEHSRTHSVARPYKCDVCSSSFRQKNVYARHMQIHLPSRFACVTCHEVFNSKSTLQQHLKTHADALTGEQEQDSVFFVCLCGLSFVSMEDLRLHTQECEVALQVQGQGPEQTQVSDVTEQNDEAASSQTLIFVKEEPSQDSEAQNESIAAESQGIQRLLVIQDGSEIPQTVSLLPSQYINNHSQVLVHELDAATIVSDATAEGGETETQLIITPGNSQDDKGQLAVPSSECTPSETEGQQEGYLCGYCNEMFLDIEVVQSHIATDHKEQLTNDDGVQVMIK